MSSGLRVQSLAEAIIQAKKLLTLNLNFVPAYLQLANCYAQLGRRLDEKSSQAYGKRSDMTQLTVQLTEADYQRLEQTAEQAGKSIQSLVVEWIAQLPGPAEAFDVTQDPIFQLEGYDSDAPADLSTTVDHYLYGSKESQ
jgi:hypothetical protein